MANRIFKKIILSSTTAGLLLYSALSYADDSEVYFGDSSGIKSNVLFILDVSGSMRAGEEPRPGSYTPLDLTSNFRRITILKDSLQKIINSKDINNLRMGVMTFTTYKYSAATTSIPIPQPIIDIDEIDTDKDIAVTNVANSTNKLITQRILVPVDNTKQGCVAPAGTVWSASPQSTAVPCAEPNSSTVLTLSDSKDATIGLRFANVLVKNPSTVGASAAAIKKATLRFYNTIAVSTARDIKIYADPADDAEYLVPYFNGLSDKINKAEYQDCRLQTTRTAQWTECDVTALMQRLLIRPNWKDGNAITLLIRTATASIAAPLNITANSDNSATSIQNSAKLLIETDPNLVAKNKITKRERILDTALSFQPDGGTPIVDALLFASTYVSNIGANAARNPYATTSAGPYHGANLPQASGYSQYYTSMPPSPITDSCQLTHLVLMTDGQAQGGKGSQNIIRYMGEKSCKIFTNNDLDPAKWKNDSFIEPYTSNYDEYCGRSLASWMARTSHSDAKATADLKDGNYVYTQTIGLALAPNSAAQNFLDDLATYGKGKSYNTNNATELTAAFKNIVTNAMNVTKPSASGSVGQSSRSNYDQRREAFFSLFKVDPYDYWAGNIKGFKLKYVKTTIKGDTNGEQPVLYSWDENSPALDTSGSFKNVSTAWSAGLDDGNDVEKGGVANKLPAPTARDKMYTKNMETLTTTSVSASDFALTGAKASADYSKALVNFMKGYKFNAPSSSAKPLTLQSPKKLGDSANNGITLVAYSCDETDKKLDVLSCPFNQLNMLGLVATNDGFFRGYNLKDGTPQFEFIPKEMLAKVDALANPKGLDKDHVRTYGLDSRIVVYHDDANNNGYIDNNEAAYAIVSSGRGGSYIYILNISDKDNVKLVTTITNTGNFSKLGNTWSTPVVGNIKVNDSIYPVAIIGGGYNPKQDDSESQSPDDIGNIIYVINLRTGTRLGYFDAGMNYSVPGELSVLTDDSTGVNLITDIFFGDMGGQLWRLKVTNQTGDNFLSGAGGDKGLIASLSGSSKEDTRRFYQKPILYKIGTNISVNIGSGYKAHPLVKDNNDRFYSIRVPLDASNKTVLKENNLAVANPKNITTDLSNIENGFMIKLGTITGTLGKGEAQGEKVISNAFADVDKLVFNTYIPDTDASRKSCSPAIGTQRTYYFNIVSGKSFLENGFTEISPSTLPLDVVAYCGDRYCAIITSINDLSGKTLLDEQFFRRSTTIQKLNWTDLFDPQS